MTVGLTAALIVAAVLGLSFRSTKVIGITATAVLCFLHPWVAALVVVITGAVFVRIARKS